MALCLTGLRAGIRWVLRSLCSPLLEAERSRVYAHPPYRTGRVRLTEARGREFRARGAPSLLQPLQQLPTLASLRSSVPPKLSYLEWEGRAVASMTAKPWVSSDRAVFCLPDSGLLPGCFVTHSHCLRLAASRCDFNVMGRGATGAGALVTVRNHWAVN